MTKTDKLIPIPGFPELSVSDEIVMQDVIDNIKKIYRLYGFVPLDTRLIEHSSVLDRKGLDGKEVYCLARLHNNDIDIGREAQAKLALKFDLTVPLARYIGQNHQTMQFPYKRYQVQKVYRGETPKMSTGRYREFYQADIDVISRNNISFYYDSEFPAIIYQIFTKVLNLKKFTIQINNRKLLEGLFMEFNITDPVFIKKAVKIIDNMEKVSVNETINLLNDVGLTLDKANDLLNIFTTIRCLDPEIAIDELIKMNFTNDMLKEGISELKIVIDGVISNGVPKEYFIVDPSIARGLSYYTGTVYETILPDLPELGSVCSGGRYGDLVSIITGNDNNKFPGVGISIGLSRLIPSLISHGILTSDKSTVAEILITIQDTNYIQKYQQIASILRGAEINVDVYYEPTKLVKQFNYANLKGYTYVIVANKEELDGNTVNVRNMKTQSQVLIPIDDMVKYFIIN